MGLIGHGRRQLQARVRRRSRLPPKGPPGTQATTETTFGHDSQIVITFIQNSERFLVLGARLRICIDFHLTSSFDESCNLLFVLIIWDLSFERGNAREINYKLGIRFRKPEHPLLVLRERPALVSGLCDDLLGQEALGLSLGCEHGVVSRDSDRRLTECA